jgi:hypothetical protein
VKLQSCSILDLVSELCVRLSYMGKEELIGPELAAILRENGHEPIEVFGRLNVTMHAAPPKKGK